MTVSDYINTFALEHDNPYEDAVILKYINLVESNVYADNIKEYLVQYYAKTLNAFQFTLPADVNFVDVKKVYVNGKKYKKKDSRAYKENHSFWYEGGKLCIYPACTETDVSYVSGVGEITFTTSTIVTTGDDFTFAIGDVVLITGCTVNAANNKTATIASVSSKTLTFAADTFTAGAETAAITIRAPKIKMTYLNVPTTKLIGNIATDTLLIADRFIDVYDYYLMAKIAYLAGESTEYQNHMLMFNAAVKRFEDWYEDNRPMSPEDDIIAEEEGSDYAAADFDSN